MASFHSGFVPVEEQAYLGSGGPSERGFMDNLQSERNTRKASFCKMCENFAPGAFPAGAPDSCSEHRKTREVLQTTRLCK